MSDVKKDKVNYAEVMAQALKEHNMSFTSKVRGDKIIFTLPMSADNAPGINVKLIIDEDGDCKLRSYLANNISQVKRPAMLQVINDLNAKYRYICLSIDQDGDICASYDFTVHEGSVPIFVQIIAMVFLYTDIADNCIPEIMQTIWAKEHSASGVDSHTIKTNLFEEEGEDE